jgi:hypothetical protein
MPTRLAISLSDAPSNPASIYTAAAAAMISSRRARPLA